MFKKIVWLGFSNRWKNAKDVKKYIKNLVDWWATEFFTGYNPDYWYTKFGFEVSPNGRFSEHEQITDLETLKQVVEEVHSYNIEIFINLNAWYYTDETFPLIKEMVKEFEELNIDWIICGNIWILEYLRDIKYSWKVNISTIMAVYNKSAIEFLLDNYDVNKVILSREITLKEIEWLVNHFPNTLFEVFWEWDFCRYNNWLCFAEHKYWAKDICTVVVNDLIIKKKFRPDFKDFILNEWLSNSEKIDLMDSSYLNPFEEISYNINNFELWIFDDKEILLNIWLIINKLKNRTDIFFDWLKPLNSERNKNIIILLKWIKLLNREEDKEFSMEVELSIKSWLQYLAEKSKAIWWDAKLKAYELSTFYSKWDNLNLYTYLFFSQFKNIETVKFPTRWRNYNEKIKIIENILKDWKVDEKYLDRWINIERTHYDLTYLFWDKLWFRNLLKTFK